VAHFMGYGDGQLVVGEVGVDENLSVGRVVEPVERRAGGLEVDGKRERRPGVSHIAIAAATPALSAAGIPGSGTKTSGWQASNAM